MLRVPTKDAKATAYTIGDGDLEMPDQPNRGSRKLQSLDTVKSRKLMLMLLPMILSTGSPAKTCVLFAD